MWDVNVCPYCGHDYRAQMMSVQQTRARGNYAGWGGALIITGGILGLLMGIIMMLVSTLSFDSLNVTLPSGFTEQDFKILLVILGVAFAVFGVVAVIGGVFAVERKHFAVTVLGGVFGIFSLGLFLGAVLALIGLILVVISRHEFGQTPASPPAYGPPPAYGAPPVGPM